MDRATVIMSGNVGIEPVSFGSAPKNGTRFRMVANYRRRDQTSGDWVDGAEYWVEVVCWGPLATGVQDSVRRGDPVLVTGHLENSSWVKDGQKHFKDQLVASVVGHDLSKGTSSFRRSSRAVEATGTGGQGPVEPAEPDEVDEPVAAEPSDLSRRVVVPVG